MISSEKINEIFQGCSITWVGSGTRGGTFFAGPKTGHITTSEAITWHMAGKSWSGVFKITKIELIEENKKRLYEYLGSLK